MTKDVTVIDNNGNTETVSFDTETARFTYDDDTEIVPFIVKDIERDSNRKKEEATSLCGNRQVSDNGEGEVTYTVEAFLTDSQKNAVLNKQGVTGMFFNDIRVEEMFIKKATVALSSDINSVLRNGQEYQVFNTQLQITVE